MICPKCQTDKPQESFPIRKCKGRSYVSGRCYSCWRLYQHLWRKVNNNPKKREAHAARQARFRQTETYQKYISTYKSSDSYRETIRKSNSKRRNNPQFRVSQSVSRRIRKLIKDKGSNHTFDLLGYSVLDLITHLKKQFRPGMTVDNHGEIWHIDHIKPVSWFQFSSKDDPQFKECWALSNLQPLFIRENLSKGNRYEGSYSP